MKKIIITAIVCAGAALTPLPHANATPDMCDNHMNQKDASFGYASSGDDPVYVPACSESGSGPDWENNAETPNISTKPVGGMEPHSSTGTNQGDSGTYDELYGIADEDGIQGHDNVKDGNLFVPQPHS